MSKLLIASLLALSSTATISTADTATPVPMPPRPGPPRCMPGYLIDELIKVESKAQIKVKDFPESVFAIASNGAWKYEQTKNGKRSLHAEGCLTDPQLITITNALNAATWKSTQAQFRCMAEPIDYTEYSLHFRHVLTSKLCDGKVFDDKTTKALAELTKLENALIATATP